MHLFPGPGRGPLSRRIEGATFTGLSRGVGTELFYPCQVKIDGEVVTAINAAGTTYNAASNPIIRLPRLAAGTHEVEFVFGEGRKLYRDAEAACGEDRKRVSLNIEVQPSDRKVVVFTKPDTDFDAYIFYPDENDALNYNLGITASQMRTSDPKSEFTILPDRYTVTAFPGASSDLNISEVGSSLSVTKSVNKTGSGINILINGDLKKKDPSSRFTITIGGTVLVIPVLI